MLFPYPTSNGDLQPFEVPEVTIGIGVLCDGGETAILASDMRVTYGNSPVSPSDYAGKQYEFSPHLLSASIAGRTNINEAVVSVMALHLSELLAQKQKQPDGLFVSEHVRHILERARKQELRKLQECAMLSELGVSLDDWLSGTLKDGRKLDDLALRWGLTILQRVKKEFCSKLALIVVGFADNGIVFMRGIGAEAIEEAASPPYYVIGSGSYAAMEVLTKRGQNTDTSIARSLLHIYEALRAARKEKTVGPPSAYVVIRPARLGKTSGVWRFPAESPLLRGWYKAYRKRSNTGSLDMPLPNDQVRGLLRRHMPRQHQVLTDEIVRLAPLEMRKSSTLSSS
jgi:20S proteasome alpha/beta subunit